ncbi:MAG: AraC family transcriptional regulator [Flavobacteriaceae bacterium]|jgi:AraC-like DNA-binding protein|nr:AraC family transcriptional regulator [Flavobacteriaceae bacterium]
MEYATALNIKNMVCHRCVLIVEQELTKIGLLEAKVELGVIYFKYDLSKETLCLLTEKLKELGFDLLVQKHEILIERVKQLIIQLVREDKKLITNLSYLIAEELQVDYSHVSKLFSERESLTIEKYYIHQRIEKVKEYISYGEYTLAEIATKMYYNDLSHLSKQFKSVMGISPSQYKKEKIYNRNYIDKIIT